MNDEHSLKDAMAKAAAAMPERAAQCGMEEAHGLGLLDGPHRDPPPAANSAIARTDFAKGETPPKPRLKPV